MNPAARRKALAAASGALLALSFPKFGQGAVAWVALAPLLTALHGATPFEGLMLGYLTGAVSALGLLYWTALVVVQYGGLSLPVGLAVMGLLCLAFAIFPLLFGGLVAMWSERLGPGALIIAPLAWTATEILRAHTFFQFPWCLLGYSQHANLPVIQIAAYTAVYGVSFVVALVSGLLAYVAVVPARGVPALLALLGLVVVLYVQGGVALETPLAERGRLRVGLVQAGILQEDKWRPEKASANIERHIELTRRAAAAGARLVVWPESAAPFYFDDVPRLAEELRQLVRRERVYLFFGNDDHEAGEGGERIYVGAKMLDPEGALTLRYRKMQLVPFGEYVPLQPLLTLGGRQAAKLVRQVSDFTPGREAAIGEVDGHRLGGFICYEAVFPALVRRFSAGGAELLVNITNDAWYGRSSAPYQHLAMAAFRAVENGKYLVRAANTGITAVVDPRGRILERSELFAQGVLVRDVPLVAGQTFYARHGDVFGWGCLGASLALSGSLLRRPHLRGRARSA